MSWRADPAASAPATGTPMMDDNLNPAEASETCTSSFAQHGPGALMI
jgi:hypothetical protein